MYLLTQQNEEMVSDLLTSYVHPILSNLEDLDCYPQDLTELLVVRSDLVRISNQIIILSNKVDECLMINE